jgi:uncharacterized protein YjbI with pentapeptide repeats
MANQHFKEIAESNNYLEMVEPRYPEWRDEALSNPEQAILRNADLGGADLSGASLVGADLSGASLNGANLVGADLSGARLSGARLSNANLSNAELSNANLSGANLLFANLSGANLLLANLSGGYLSNANLSNADLNGANLSGADLIGANLSGADLLSTDLTKAELPYSDLGGANYSPVSEAPSPYLVGIKGLSSVRATDTVGLVQLRKLLQDAGLRDLEREATYSIERAKTTALFEELLERPGMIRNLPFMSAAIFRRLCFDLTTAYGLHPFRALFLIIGIWFLCVPVYWWSIVHDPALSQQASGIYQIFPANRIDGPAAEPTIWEKLTVRRLHAASWWDAVPTAAYFSLLSAVNIGFQEFTPGDWIQRLQPHEYALRGEGWVRIVAGAQALLSVYLLAIWVLTQFGRPFQ